MSLLPCSDGPPQLHLLTMQALVLRLWYPAASDADQASMQAAHASAKRLAGRAFDHTFGPLSLVVGSSWGAPAPEGDP